MHEGHRQRMYEKLENGDDLFDHEVLEILLYAVCPRINTNPLAHKLMDRFVTLYNVLNASVKELKGVDGVGDAVAKYLRSVIPNGESTAPSSKNRTKISAAITPTKAIK